MTQVVFTAIENLGQLATAKWAKGDNDSYENTKSMVPDAALRLIGREDKYGRVTLCYAASDLHSWVEVNTWHLCLAQFFLQKFDQRPESDTLREFFTEIDDTDAMNAAQQLISIECGINVKKELHEDLHQAINCVSVGLRALTVPTGDWTFTPMLRSFSPQAA